jgi:hypothetical protein
MGRHGCYDFDLTEYLTQEQGEALMEEYHKYNGDPEEYRPGEYQGSFDDYALLGFLGDKLLESDKREGTHNG